jgi:hypothetical protein
MVTKSKKDGAKKGRIKVGKLKVNKETVKDLSAAEQKKLRAGLGPIRVPTITCATVCVKD